MGQSKKSAEENGKREKMNYHLLMRKMDLRIMTIATVSKTVGKKRLTSPKDRTKKPGNSNALQPVMVKYI